jgi:DNA-directed RNA polymerase subunit RPC12/RpoP
MVDRHEIELVCVECGARSADAGGWRGLLAGGYEDELEFGIHCPECAAREFND